MYKRILVGIDCSTTSLRGLDEAIRLAKAFDGKLLLVHVVNELLSGDIAAYDKVIASLREAGAKVLEQAVTHVRQSEVTCDQKLLNAVGERPADLIVQEAKAWPADLIVLGTHGRRGIKRLALGSDAELVLRMSPVPVLLIRDQPEMPQ